MLIGSSNCSDASRRSSSAIGDRLAGRQKDRPVLVEAHDALAGRSSAAGRRRAGGVIRLAEAAGVQEHADAGLAQDVLQLGGLVGGVDVDEDGADAGGGVLDDDPLEAIGRPDADAVARRDAQGQQAAGGPRRASHNSRRWRDSFASRRPAPRGRRGARRWRGGCRRWSGRAAASGRRRGNREVIRRNWSHGGVRECRRGAFPPAGPAAPARHASGTGSQIGGSAASRPPGSRTTRRGRFPMLCRIARTPPT